MQKNVILLGGSNSIMVDGLQKGIRDGIMEKGGFTFYNFALGACTSFQNLYELKRARNREIFENAELIITESNVNDALNTQESHEKLPLQIFYRNLQWFYKELYFLNKKVVSLLLPNEIENHKIINNLHKMLCTQYGFNCIDMQGYYEDNGLSEFGKRIDWAHQLESIMYVLGKNIMHAMDTFELPKNLSITNDNPEFFECSPKDMELLNGELREIHMQNSMYNEMTYRIDSTIALKFPKHLQNCYLIGLHTWSNTTSWQENFKPPIYWDEFCLSYSSLDILDVELSSFRTSELLDSKDFEASDTKFLGLESINGESLDEKLNGGGGGQSPRKISIVKEVNMLHCVVEMQHNLRPTENTICKLHTGSVGPHIKEYYHAALSWHENSHEISFCDVVSFFFAGLKGNYHDEKLNFSLLAKQTFSLHSSYDHTHIIPPVITYKIVLDNMEQYRAIIDEYCRKITPQEKIQKKELNETKTTSMQKILFKVKIRMNKQYFKYKLRKMLHLHGKKK